MFEKFYEKYAAEEQEVLALIQTVWGAGAMGGDWCMRAGTLGMVFCADGRAEIKKGRLEWPVLHRELDEEKGWKRFRDGQICRLRVRRLLAAFVPDPISPEEYNCWAVVKVLEPSASCPCLDAVWEEYQRPVVIQDEGLGTLVLNRKFGQLEGRLRQNGREIPLFLEIDQEDRETWDAACSAARRWMEDGGGWDKAMREFAAKELTRLANEWQEEDGAPITEEAFAGRIGLSELYFTWEGEFTAYYDDGDLFWGHAVEVCGSLENGAEKADIMG